MTRESSALPHASMRKLRVLFLLAFASSMSTLSMDFFAPSMPDATRALATTPEAIKSTLVAFLVGFGLGPFLWGTLADRLGRRRTLLIGIGCYILASVGCLLSSGIGAFLAWRVLQGIGAASGSVVSRAVLRDVYGATGATRAIARMILIMVWVPITAPFLGGMMGAWFEWRVSFLVMAVIAGLTLLGALLWLTETNPAHEPSALPQSNRWKEILSHRRFLGYALPNMFCFTAMLLFLSSYSYIAEARFGFSPRENGLVLTGFNAAVSAGCYLVMATVPRIGVEASITSGMWMAVAGWSGFCAVALLPELGLPFAVGCLVLACLGSGMIVALNTGQALIPFPHAAGTAAALFLLLQSFGASAINLAAGAWLRMDLQQLAFLLAACALLALASSRLSRPAP